MVELYLSPFNSQIKIFEDKFYVVDTKNILRCFSVIDGKEIWTTKQMHLLLNHRKEYL